MPRIEKYSQDNSISDSDTILGSDADSSNETKKYTMLDIKNFVIPSGGTAGPLLLRLCDHHLEQTPGTTETVISMHLKPLKVLYMQKTQDK